MLVVVEVVAVAIGYDFVGNNIAGEVSKAWFLSFFFIAVPTLMR